MCSRRRNIKEDVGVIPRRSLGPTRKPEQITSQVPKSSRWTVVHYVRADKRKHGGWDHFWLCRCSCGTEEVRTLGHVMSGRSRSCGCIQIASVVARNRTHGLSKHPCYSQWKAMHKRCRSRTDPAYHRYGGRGIRVCKRWSGRDGFLNFIADMGEQPEGCNTVERKRVNENYTPENCCWASRSVQNRNKRNNRRITFRGRTQCLQAWAEELGMPQSKLYYRIVTAGWDVERAFMT